ncbi:sensor histidine kinase [Periweissella fabalis]|uniref:histidine kinase n=1 Tax=Periweissella fabalis TaxID=1070421 RepID=A0A7X6N5L0_9LACO|nr:ATP-binding protein [Periweissella fabalis]MCM0599796.1 PAS domain-containing protein [Periweissella fabalis]NKZ24398.1 PAS domain-containing protein [Periweissella fabalis]
MQKQVWQRITLISVVLLSINISIALILVRVLDTMLKLNFAWTAIIASTILTSVQIGMYAMIVMQRQSYLNIMTEKLEAIAAEKNPSHILLDKGDPYYDVINAINNVQSFESNKVYWLRRREGELTTLIQHLPVGVLVVNHHRKIKIMNAAANNLLGVNLIIGEPLYSIITNHYALTVLLEKIMDTHEEQRKAIQIETDEGIKHLEVTMVYHETSQTHFQIVIILYDLTEVVQLEQMQVDFVSNASHELKTPVTAINGFAETLLAGAKDDPATLNQFLMIINNESKRLIDLVEDVLSISRFSTADVGDEQDDVQIAIKTWLDNEIASMSRIAANKNVEVIDATPVSFNVTTKENYLTQIVKNLVSNAIKYNKDGGAVVITAQPIKTGWQLEIKDNGIGIPSTQLPRVFERFYRGDASRTQQIASGTGLGLAIVKELVTKLNGEISMKSQVGVGTTVTIIFNNV